MDSDAAEQSLQKTDKKASTVATSLANGVKTAAKWGTAIAGAAMTASAGVAKLVTNTAATADNIDKMSQKIGISAESYQEWDYIMGQCGADVDLLQSGMKTLVSKMSAAADGNESAIASFEALGLSVYDANGNLKSQDEMLNEVIGALSSMEDSTERASLATALLGKSGSELAPMFNAGSEAIEGLRQSAHDMNIVMSDEAVASGVKMSDTIDNIKKSVGGMVNELGATVMPVVQELLDFLMSMMPTIQGMFSSLAPVAAQLLQSLLPPIMQLVNDLLPVVVKLITTLIPPIAEIASAILPLFVEVINMLLPPILQIAQAVLPILVNLIQQLLPIIEALLPVVEPLLNLLVSLLVPVLELIMTLLQPFIDLFVSLATSLAEALVPAVEKLAKYLGEVLLAALNKITPVVESVKQKFETFFGFLKGVFSQDWGNIWNGAVDTFKGIFNTIPSIAEKVINNAIGVINKLIGGVNKITGVVGISSIPEISEVKLPRMAKGGVIGQEGMAVVGEDGAELINMPKGATVTPLNGNNDPLSRQVGELIEATKQQNELLQNMLEAFLGGQSITIDKREFGRLVRGVSNA